MARNANLDEAIDDVLGVLLVEVVDEFGEGAKVVDAVLVIGHDQTHQEVDQHLVTVL